MKQAVLQTGKGIETIAHPRCCRCRKPGPGEALVRLHAATLNFRDIIMAKDLIPGIAKEPDLVPLSCAAGVVEAVGDGVTRVKAGDRVTPLFAIGWINGPQATRRHARRLDRRRRAAVCGVPGREPGATIPTSSAISKRRRWPARRSPRGRR